MRKILITVATIVSLQSLAQVNIPVEFNVNQTAKVWMGKKFTQYIIIEIDHSFGEMAITLKVPVINTSGQVIGYNLYSSI